MDRIVSTFAYILAGCSAFIAVSALGNLIYVAIAVIGGFLVATGGMSLGDVQAFIQYSRQFGMPLAQIAGLMNMVQSGVASAERLFELLDAQEEAAESKELVYAACERAGLKYWKSATNFVLIDGAGRARALVDGMIARGVFVRDRTRDPACPNCFRLTSGVVEHTRTAVETLEALCAHLR